MLGNIHRPNIVTSQRGFLRGGRLSIMNILMRQRTLMLGRGSVSNISVLMPFTANAIRNLASLKADDTYGDFLYEGSRFQRGEYIVLFDNSQAFWDGNTWESGVATAAPPALDISNTMPFDSYAFADLEELVLDEDHGDEEYAGDPFTAGQYIVLGDDSQAHWSGTAWTEGEAPEPE